MAAETAEQAAAGGSDLTLANLWARVVVPGLMLAFFAEAGLLAKPWLGEGYASLIFVLGITLIGAVAGLMTAVICALLGSLIFNFVIAEPVWQIAFTRHSDFATPAVFIACAVISGLMSGRLRDETRRARTTNRQLQTLLEISRSLQGAETAPAIQAVLRATLARGGAMVPALFQLDQQGLVPVGANPGPAWSELAARAVAGVAEMLREGPLVATALSGGHGLVGALVIEGPDDELSVGNFLPALSRVTALALERAELAAAITEAQAQSRAEELKTTLLSSISHDLRTPLTTISTSAASLLAFQGEIDPDTARELLEGIVGECDRLNRLTANLLEMSRLQAGEEALHPAVLPVAEMVRSRVNQLRQHSPGHRFDFTAPDGELHVSADPALFELALGNVLENAVKFSPADGAIAIACLRREGSCAITVTDTGPGIPRAEQERVFERFYRAADARHGPRGTGLGLAIARGFVKASGGDIAITSPVAEGRGTTLTITLPLAGEDEPEGTDG